MVEDRVVVIGASAGGVEALIELFRAFPKEFPAPIFIVVHVPPDSPSILPDILSRRGALSVKHAEDGEAFRPGVGYVAPPDRHLIILQNGTVRVVRGPRENRHRPSVDPLFRSAALAYGPRAIGIILTGTLDDGTAGLLAIKDRGGIAIAQDPHEAVYPSMPLSAITHVDVDEILPLGRMPSRLLELLGVTDPRTARGRQSLERLQMEQHITLMDEETMQNDDRPGQPSAFSCPDCGGVLWQIDDGEYSRYRCRVGHALSPETMLGAQGEILEEALWTALKTLEESARLASKLAATERDRGHDWMVKRFEAREQDARGRAEIIRRFLERDTSEVPVPVPPSSAQS